jgi:hypothetical protein
LSTGGAVPEDYRASSLRVATITFHWATNYGAVLQAYALQEYLVQLGMDVEIIDYRPARNIFLRSLDRVRRGRFTDFVTEARLREFRQDHLKMSSRTYRSSRSLRYVGNAYAVYVCGSDQIWNESFIWHAEGRPTLSYYLHFVADGRRRVSYAASFGADHLSPAAVSLVQPRLAKFSALSVRENTGRAILGSMGFDATVVVDPTLMLDGASYEALIPDYTLEERRGVYSYILHTGQSTVLGVEDRVRRRYRDVPVRTGWRQRPGGMLEWLAGIRNSEIVVTNSFHGVALSVIFHTPFIVVPVEGSTMNDRLSTLLGALDLGGRVVADLDDNRILRLCEERIDWERVDAAVESLRTKAESFLRSAITGEPS